VIAAPAPEAQAQKESTPETVNLPGHATNGILNTYHNEGVNQGAKLAENITKHIGPAVLIPIPKGQKGPKLQGWQRLSLADMTPIHYAGLAGGNVGVSLGTASGGLVTIDADSDAFLEAFLATNPPLHGTLITKGARGGNVWLRIKGGFPKAGKLKTADGAPWGEFRADGNQTVIHGTHPSGCLYTHNCKPPMSVEFSTIQWPAGLRLPWVQPLIQAPAPPKNTKPTGSSVLERARAYVDKMPPAIQGKGGSDATFNVAKVLAHDFDLSQGEAMSILQDYNARCAPPWSDKELAHKLEDAAKCSRASRGRGELVEANRPDYRPQPKHYEVATVGQVDPIDYEVPAPVLSDAALYGVAGDIVRKIAPETEAHPASLLLQLLTGIGNLIGRGPHFMAGADSHHTNLFCAIVGDSSRGRKGTSWGYVRRILEEVDPTWAGTRIKGGLASGEGIVAELKDDEETEPKDKRLLLMEGELAQALQVMNKNGSTLSATLRNAWDSGHLNNLSKGNPARASDCHISLVGHITRTELNTLLTSNDAANGFANRVLWVHSARTRLLPEGGEDLDFTIEVNTLREIVTKSRNRGAIRRTQGARDYWHSIYPDLSREDVPGRWGQATSRAEAQVVRLSLLFALMDLSEQIEVEHLQAAKGLWGYCFHSARWALEVCRYSKEAQKIIDALASGPKDRTYIVTSVFSGNILKGRLDAALKELEGTITMETQETGGHPRTIYALKKTNT
jgi:hypothetical protein